jgi:hypothetical protein
MMAIRRARHCIAALHRLFRCSHRQTVKSMRGERDNGDDQQDCLGNPHCYENRSIAWMWQLLVRWHQNGSDN